MSGERKVIKKQVLPLLPLRG